MGLVTGIEAAFELGDLERAEQLIASIEARPPGAVPRYNPYTQRWQLVGPEDR